MADPGTQPCPCGSGLDYASCCEALDQAHAKAESSAPEPLPQEMRDLIAQTDRWEMDIAAVGWFPGLSPRSRPAFALVCAGGVPVRGMLLDTGPAEPTEVAEFLAEFLEGAAEAAGGWPRSVVVRHEEVGAALEPLLRPRSVDVEVSFRMKDLDGVAMEIFEDASGERRWPQVSTPAMWSAWGLPVDVVAEVFAAAARFHGAEPGRVLTFHDALIVFGDTCTGWAVTVQGAEGEPGGATLTIYTDPDDLRNTAHATDIWEVLRNLSGWILMLDLVPRATMPELMRAEIERGGWELADPEVYPKLTPIQTPGGGVTAEVARRLAAILRLVADFAETHGSPQQHVGEGILSVDDGDLALLYVPAEAVEGIGAMFEDELHA